MAINVRFFLPVVIFTFFVMQSMAAELYRCEEEGDSPRIFRKDACQLLSDPTAPFQESAVVLSKSLIIQQPKPRLGPWYVSQLFVPIEVDKNQDGVKQAVINGRRVGLGDVVAGGRVQAITKRGVTLSHTGGETQVPFGQKTVANGTPPPLWQLPWQDLDKDLPGLLQRLTAGQSLLILRDGKPLAKVLPISPEMQP